MVHQEQFDVSESSHRNVKIRENSSKDKDVDEEIRSDIDSENTPTEEDMDNLEKKTETETEAEAEIISTKNLSTFQNSTSEDSMFEIQKMLQLARQSIRDTVTRGFSS